MAYYKSRRTRRGRGRNRRSSARKRLAGRTAKKKSRQSFKTAIKLLKRRGGRALAKLYATKVGQTTYAATKNRKRRSRRSRRKRRY